MPLPPIIPPDPIEANVDYRYDGCYQSMVLVLLQRIVDASGGGGGTGLATEAKQDDQITLATAANSLLTSLEGKDFATETTLDAVRVLIASLDGKDYATETTLAAIKTVADNIKLDTAKLDVNLSTRATETTLEAVRLLLVSLEGKDFATETTLAAIKAQTDLLNFTGAKLRTTGEDGGGGGGASIVGLKDIAGDQINPTKEETQESVLLFIKRTENLLLSLLEEQKKTNKYLRKIVSHE